MREGRHALEHGALGDGRAVLLCHDHDKARKKALEAAGGRVVGWVDGYYRISSERAAGGAS